MWLGSVRVRKNPSGTSCPGDNGGILPLAMNFLKKVSSEYFGVFAIYWERVMVCHLVSIRDFMSSELYQYLKS